MREEKGTMMGKKDASTVKINTILGKESDFQGDFTATGSARLDGSVNGNVNVTGMLIVGAGGNISGGVEAYSAVIGGAVLGDVKVENKLELTSTARILGDIETKVIVIDEGAIFQGKCNMNQEVPESKPRNLNKAVRSGRKSAKAAIQEALKEVEEEALKDAMDQNTDQNMDQITDQNTESTESIVMPEL